MTVQDKLQQLQTLFAQMERALIAYSGGIDSTLVAKVAFDVLRDKALAITANSPPCCQKILKMLKYRQLILVFPIKWLLPTKWIIPITQRIR